MKHLLIILSLLLHSSPLFGQETGVLYGWGTPSGFHWKSFGDADIQAKYNGEIKDGKPDGFGNLFYPTTRGKKVTGEWKDGEQLNTNHYNKVGDIIGQWLNGVEQYVVLFGRIVNGNVEWSENRGENYTMKYIGETKNEKPHGKGTGTSSKGKKYIGKWKNGVPHGQGEYTYSNGEKYAG